MLMLIVTRHLSIGTLEREWKRVSLLKHERIWDFWKRIIWMFCRNKPRMTMLMLIVTILKLCVNMFYLQSASTPFCLCPWCSFFFEICIFNFLCDLQFLSILCHLQPDIGKWRDAS